MGAALSTDGAEPGAPRLDGKTPYVDGLSPQEYFDYKVWPALEDIWGAFNSESVSDQLVSVARCAADGPRPAPLGTVVRRCAVCLWFVQGQGSLASRPALLLQSVALTESLRHTRELCQRCAVTEADGWRMFVAFVEADKGWTSRLSFSQWCSFVGATRSPLTEYIFTSQLKFCPSFPSADIGDSLVFQGFVAGTWELCTCDDRLLARMLFSVFDADASGDLDEAELEALISFCIGDGVPSCIERIKGDSRPSRLPTAAEILPRAKELSIRDGGPDSTECQGVAGAGATATAARETRVFEDAAAGSKTGAIVPPSGEVIEDFVLTRAQFEKLTGEFDALVAPIRQIRQALRRRTLGQAWFEEASSHRFATLPVGAGAAEALRHFQERRERARDEVMRHEMAKAEALRAELGAQALAELRQDEAASWATMGPRQLTEGVAMLTLAALRRRADRESRRADAQGRRETKARLLDKALCTAVHNVEVQIEKCLAAHEQASNERLSAAMAKAKEEAVAAVETRARLDPEERAATQEMATQALKRFKTLVRHGGTGHTALALEWFQREASPATLEPDRRRGPGRGCHETASACADRGLVRAVGAVLGFAPSLHQAAWRFAVRSRAEPIVEAAVEAASRRCAAQEAAFVASLAALREELLPSYGIADWCGPANPDWIRGFDDDAQRYFWVDRRSPEARFATPPAQPDTDSAEDTDSRAWLEGQHGDTGADIAAGFVAPAEATAAAAKHAGFKPKDAGDPFDFRVVDSPPPVGADSRNANNDLMLGLRVHNRHHAVESMPLALLDERPGPPPPAMIGPAAKPLHRGATALAAGQHSDGSRPTEPGREFGTGGGTRRHAAAVINAARRERDLFGNGTPTQPDEPQ